MAEDKKTTKPGAVPEYERRNFRRGIIVFFVALFILGSIAWGGWVLKGRLFQENRYFVLRNIEITSSLGANSRWSGDNAVDDLAAIMGWFYTKQIFSVRIWHQCVIGQYQTVRVLRR